MATQTSEETLRRLKASGLRGRGGAWFETHRKWRAVMAEGGRPLVVANGGEGEPGSINDRFVMRLRPQHVVSGLKLAMDTMGADHGYVYLKGSFRNEEARLHGAIDALGFRGLITVHRGDDTYVGGEETALLESIEGRVAWPRPKPPRPASVGLFGRPTLVQNVDTLARVAEAVRRGVDFASDHTLTITLWGDVRCPGAYEVRAGRTIQSVIEAEGGGATSNIGLVFPNGAHSMPLDATDLDTPLDPESLVARGSSLGTASILVLDEAAAPYSILESIARFFEREACGQCPPCVQGTTNLRSLVTGARPSTNRLAPQAAIRETASFMSMHGYCAHCRSGASSVTGLFSRFEEAVIERLRVGPRALDQRDRDPFAQGSVERASLDTFLQAV